MSRRRSATKGMRNGKHSKGSVSRVAAVPLWVLAQGDGRGPSASARMACGPSSPLGCKAPMTADDLLVLLVERWTCEYHCCTASHSGVPGHSGNCPLMLAGEYLTEMGYTGNWTPHVPQVCALYPTESAPRPHCMCPACRPDGLKCGAEPLAASVAPLMSICLCGHGESCSRCA